MLIFLSSAEPLTPDEQSFLETIYNSEGKKMWYIAISMLKNIELAEDAVQTAFLKLAKHISTLQAIHDKNKQGYYIHTIVGLKLHNRQAEQEHRDKQACRHHGQCRFFTQEFQEFIFDQHCLIRSFLLRLPQSGIKTNPPSSVGRS